MAASDLSYIPSAPQRRLSAAEKTDLDFLVDSVQKEDEADIKHRLHRMVYEAVTHPVRVMYERESSINYQYTENDFYTEEELAGNAL